MLCTSGVCFNDSRALCAGVVEAECRFKQLYFKESLTFQYMLKKIIKHHLQNIPICSSFEREKRKEKAAELIFGLKLSSSLQLGILVIVM